MASDAPSWLTPDPAAEPEPGATAAALEVDSPRGKNATADAGLTPPVDDKELPGIILTMRLANMGVAGALMAISILHMIQIRHLSTIVLAVYANFGALLICCLETQLKFLRVMIAVNFGFLFNALFRFLFYMVLGSVAWSYDWIVGQIVAAALVFVAFFNTYVLCRYPAYRRIREQIAEEEDKRIEARISKEVKRQAINQMTK